MVRFKLFTSCISTSTDTGSTISKSRDDSGDGREGELTSALKIWPHLYLSDIANFKVRSDDIFIASYIKSGKL